MSPRHNCGQYSSMVARTKFAAGSSPHTTGWRHDDYVIICGAKLIRSRPVVAVVRRNGSLNVSQSDPSSRLSALCLDVAPPCCFASLSAESSSSREEVSDRFTFWPRLTWTRRNQNLDCVWPPVRDAAIRDLPLAVSIKYPNVSDVPLLSLIISSLIDRQLSGYLVV